MPTEQLIDNLIGELTPVRPRKAWKDGAVIAALCVAEVAAYVGMGHVRPDMPAAMHEPSMWWKFGSLAALALVAIFTAIRSFDPISGTARGLRLAAAVAAGALVVGWGIDATAAHPASLAQRLDWRAGVDCVIAVLLLATPPALALGLLMRKGAPSNHSGSALASGLASAAIGALVFVFQCPHNDPLYIAVWYGVAMLLVTGAVRLILPPLTRW